MESRLGELCQLRSADIREIDGMPVLALTDEGENQSIKSDVSHPLVKR